MTKPSNMVNVARNSASIVNEMDMKKRVRVAVQSYHPNIGVSADVWLDIRKEARKTGSLLHMELQELMKLKNKS